MKTITKILLGVKNVFQSGPLKESIVKCCFLKKLEKHNTVFENLRLVFKPGF